MTPQQNLNMFFFTYVCQLAAEGQYQALMNLGFKRYQIPIMQSLSISDLAGIAVSVNASVIQAKVDPTAVDILFRIGDRLRMEREIELKLIEAGASQRLMRELFGTNVQQYGAERELLGLKGTDCGRRPRLDMETIDRVWAMWHGGEHGDSEAEKYLSIYQSTNVSVRDIEAIVRGDMVADAPDPNPGHRLREAQQGERQWT